MSQCGTSRNHPLQEINARVDSETAKIDALTAATGRTIALIRERRAALIAAAVSGAIEVRNANSSAAVETPTQ